MGEFGGAWVGLVQVVKGKERNLGQTCLIIKWIKMTV